MTDSYSVRDNGSTEGTYLLLSVARSCREKVRLRVGDVFVVGGMREPEEMGTFKKRISTMAIPNLSQHKPRKASRRSSARAAGINPGGSGLPGAMGRFSSARRTTSLFLSSAELVRFKVVSLGGEGVDAKMSSR